MGNQLVAFLYSCSACSTNSCPLQSGTFTNFTIELVAYHRDLAALSLGAIAEDSVPHSYLFIWTTTLSHTGYGALMAGPQNWGALISPEELQFTFAQEQLPSHDHGRKRRDYGPERLAYKHHDTFDVVLGTCLHG